MSDFDLRAIRIEAGLTLGDLMDATDKCQSTIVRMQKRGKGNPIELLEILSELTGKAPVELVPWLGKRPSPRSKRRSAS